MFELLNNCDFWSYMKDSILQQYIEYYKWDRKDYQRLFQSARDKLSLYSGQFYMPMFSLYYFVHNTPRAPKTIDMSRRYYLQEWLETTKERYYNSNRVGDAIIYDSSRNISDMRKVFCKSIPILDPMHCINNNYNLHGNQSHYLPSGYSFNTFQKINSMDNSAYIDTFCSYLLGQLTLNKQSPSFPLFYGSLNGIGEYKYDITEEYPELRMDKCFHQNIDKHFRLDYYGSDTEDSTDSDVEDVYRDDISITSDNESHSSEEYPEDYIAVIPKMPIQLLFIESLEATLEDYLNHEDFKEEVLISCLFQVSFALAMLQRRYQFTHNDLHINNIMYNSTESKYLYYKINNKYYRVPTYGKIFKIIDFGRAIFTFKHKTYMNDVFSRHGEAGGQYSYPSQVTFSELKKTENYSPNYSFDMCRLAMTILEELSPTVSETVVAFLRDMCRNDKGDNLCEMNDDFSLYIAIGQTANNALPREILESQMFHEYRISKKLFPRKSFYTL